MKVSMATLKSASPKKREELLAGLVANTRKPADTERLTERIAEYERGHGMSSREMKEQLDAGHIEETDEVASWLMLLHLRERAVA